MTARSADGVRPASRSITFGSSRRVARVFAGGTGGAVTAAEARIRIIRRRVPRSLDAVATDCYCIPMTTTQSTETTYVNLKDAAAELRTALRGAFAGVKFSVRGHSYSGGASIDVSWTDGPTVAAVDEIAQQFAGASFDGMTDSMSYVKRNGKHYASDFVFTNREISEDVYSTALGEIIDAARAERYEGADDLLAVHRYGTFLPTPNAVWQRTGMAEGPVDAWVRAWIDAR